MGSAASSYFCDGKGSREVSEEFLQIIPSGLDGDLIILSTSCYGIIVLFHQLKPKIATFLSETSVAY